VRVVDVAVYRLPIYVFDGYVDSVVRGRIIGQVIDP
jgi:hypothetical protein